MRTFLIAVLVVLLLGVLGYGGYFVYKEYGVGESQQVIVTSSTSTTPTPPPISVLKEAATDADVFDALQNEMDKNKDTVGWIKIPGTTINNSVVQSHNNMYYMRIDERKQPDVFGCYFADTDSSLSHREGLFGNTVIYGHSDLKDNPDGKRFSQLFKFTQQSFAQKTPYIYLTVPEEKQVWEIFSVFYTDTDFDYIRSNIEPSEMLKMANEAKALSLYNYNIDLTAQDKILTLSTCAIKFKSDGSGRFVVMARLLPEDTQEKSEILLTLN